MGWTPGTKGKIVGDVVVLKARNSRRLGPYKGKLKNAIVLAGAGQFAPSLARPVWIDNSVHARTKKATSKAAMAKRQAERRCPAGRTASTAA